MRLTIWEATRIQGRIDDDAPWLFTETEFSGHFRMLLHLVTRLSWIGALVNSGAVEKLCRSSRSTLATPKGTNLELQTLQTPCLFPDVARNPNMDGSWSDAATFVGISSIRSSSSSSGCSSHVVEVDEAAIVFVVVDTDIYRNSSSKSSSSRSSRCHRRRAGGGGGGGSSGVVVVLYVGCDSW